jgi:hypothetical protein
LLRGAAELRKGDLNDQRLLHWSQGFDQFLQETQAADQSRMGLKAKKRRKIV